MENENGPPEGAEAKADPTMAAAAASAPSNNSGCEGSSVSASSSNGSGGSVTSVLWRMMNEDRSTTNKSSDNESDIYDAKGLKLSSITNEEIDDIIVTKEGNNWASDSSEISSNGGSEEGGRSSPKTEDGRREEDGEGKELAKVEKKLAREDQKVAVAARVTQDSNREDVQGASSTSDRQWQQQPRRSPAMQAQLEHLLSLYRRQRKNGDAAMRGRTTASGCTSDVLPADGGPAAPPSSSTSDQAAAVDDHDGTKDESLDILCQMIIEGKGGGCGSKGGGSKDGSSNASGSSLTEESQSESGSDAGDVPDSGGEGGGGVDLDNL